MMEDHQEIDPEAVQPVLLAAPTVAVVVEPPGGAPAARYAYRVGRNNRQWDYDVGARNLYNAKPDHITDENFVGPQAGVDFELENLLLAGYNDGSIILWDYTTQAVLGKLNETRGTGDNPICFSKDGTLLATTMDVHIKIWDVETGNFLFILGRHYSDINAFAFNHRGNQLVSCDDDNTVNVWKITTTEEGRCGEFMFTLRDHSSYVRSVCFNCDDTVIASCSDDSIIAITDALTGDILRKLNGHTDGVISVRFHPDGMRLLSGSFDNTLKLWDTHTGDLICTFEGANEPFDIAVSSDGCQAFAANSQEGVTVYNIETRESRQAISDQGTLCMHFSPYESILACGMKNGHTQVWNANSWELIADLVHPDRRSCTQVRLHSEQLFIFK
jgi:WD40 repeat protein